MGTFDRLLFVFQTLSFNFLDCDKIPPPVVQVQNVSFKYKDDGVSLDILFEK